MIYECAAFRNDLIPHCIVRLNNLVAQLGTKGGLISKGIFTLVSSKKVVKSLSSSFSHKLNLGWKVEDCDLAHFLRIILN